MQRGTKEIRTSSHILGTIVAQSPISTQIFSPDGVTVMVNIAWEHMWKTKGKDIVGNYNILSDPQLQEQGLLPSIQKAFAGEKIKIPLIKYTPEKTLPHISRVQYRWVRAIMYPILDEHKKVTYVVLQQEDLTKVYETQMKLLESQQRFEELLRYSTDAITLIDAKGKRLYVSPSRKNMLGYSTKEDSSGSIFDHMHPDDIPKARKALTTIMHAKKNTSSVQIRVRHKDGNWIWVEATGVNLLEVPSIGAIAITYHDITQQKEVEEEKSDFLSMASHELKTPLTSMKMFLELLARVVKPSRLEQAKYFINRIQDQTNQLVELTNDLLDVSRIETGKLRLNYETFALDELVSETVEAITTATRTHKLVLSHKSHIVVTADRYRIFQVLINLLTNAIKYSPAGKDIIISLEKRGDDAVVHVQDFGIGISKSQQKKVFQKLYQTTEPKEKTYPGLGLGLYIAKEIIERHRGIIWVESSKGNGSTFSFRIPRLHENR